METKPKFIRDLKCSGAGACSQKLWEVSGRFVVTSAAHAYSGDETYVFPSDEEGAISSWGELEGSFRGSINHQEAVDGYASSLV